MEKDDLKLIYVLKIGYDSKGRGLYEFLFSKDPSSIDAEGLGWNQVPAKGNAQPPEDDVVDLELSLKTNKIDFICLHELEDRPYMDGYYTVHCLAYENIDSNNSDVMYDETTLMVFHYGMTVKEVKNKFLERDILLKENEIVKKTPVVPVVNENDDEEDEELNF